MEKNLKRIIRQAIKKSEFLTFLNAYRLKKISQINNIKYRKMNRKETFEYIYQKHKWGG